MKNFSDAKFENRWIVEVLLHWEALRHTAEYLERLELLRHA